MINIKKVLNESVFTYMITEESLGNFLYHDKIMFVKSGIYLK